MPMHIVQKNPHDFIPQGSGNNQSDSSQSFVTWNIEWNKNNRSGFFLSTNLFLWIFF
jgi:hypothetical protein